MNMWAVVAPAVSPRVIIPFSLAVESVWHRALIQGLRDGHLQSLQEWGHFLVTSFTLSPTFWPKILKARGSRGVNTESWEVSEGKGDSLRGRGSPWGWCGQ